jgi:predicted DNA-binding transcriptional regulator YafY
MAKKRASASEEKSVSTRRAQRLFRLVSLLGKRRETRESLTRRLKVGVRDFYRDLKTLRDSDIEVQFEGGKYSLAESPAAAAQRLPFPDPNLTLGEAETLSRGRSAAHRKLREVLANITKAAPARAKTRKKR